MRKTSKIIYRPESQIRQPLRLFRAMGRDLLASRELAWRLLVRDLRSQYRQSLLGIFWAFIPPIITAASLSLAKSNGIINIGNTELPYPAYVMLNMTLWQTFTAAVTAPIQAVSSAKSMLAQINFPHEALILAKLGEIFFNFGIALVLIVCLFIWFKISVTWSVVLAPLALVNLVLLGTCIGLLLAPIGSLYQDINRVLTFIIGFLLFLTPVVYPAPSRGIFGTIVKLNPVTPLLATTRELATTGIVSDLQGFWIASLISTIGLLVAWIVYRLAMPFVIERISL